MLDRLVEGLSPRDRSWNVAMAASPGELDLRVKASQIEGRLPASLVGTRMLSNGPGWTKIGGRLAHPFDGHGYVRAFSFMPDGSCEVRARFVRTPVYEGELEAGKVLHRGLATNVEGPFWKNLSRGIPRNVANTTITRWGGRLLAGWEGGCPYALDAESLDTRGEEVFGGSIAGQMTLAHMKHDHRLDRLVLCSVGMGKETRFTFREIDEEEEVVATSEAHIKGMLFTHDFAMTPSYFVLGGNPLRLKPFEIVKMFLGTSTMLRCVSPNDQKPGVLHLIPRGSEGPVRTVRLPGSLFVVHFGNAFERDGDVIVDACVFSHFDLE